MRYYLLHDNGLQWFSAIIAVKSGPNAGGYHSEDDIQEFLDLDTSIKSEFIRNIGRREYHFGNREIRNQGWTGWSLSPAEYGRIKDIIKLHPEYQKYLTLTGSEL